MLAGDLSAATLMIFSLGAATGMLSGLLGVGGGFLLVPALALIGWPMANAVGTSLAYVAVVGAGGAWTHWRAGNVELRFVLWMGVPAAACAPAGAALAKRLPDAWLALAFAVFLVAMAGLMRKGQSPPQGPPSTGASQTPHRQAVALGASVGVLSGIFGVGGGLLLVPAQVTWLGIPLKRAVGNSLAAVLLTGISGTVAHIQLGSFEPAAGIPLIAGGLIGVVAGSRLLKHIPTERLKASFWIFLLLLAIATGVRAGLSLLA
jgi:uncharacterized protein